MKTIRWGIIGCGDVTEVKSGPGFQKAANSALVAVMRRNAVLAEDYARRHGVPAWYSDAQALIDSPDVDAVYIATPPGSHKEYTLAAAAARKPVYVEKPMALDAAECDAMISACRAAGVPLFVAYYRRALPRFLHVKQLLDSGALGQVRFVHMQLERRARPEEGDPAARPWRFDPAISGGGHFLDVGSHQLDLLDFLLAPPETVCGVAVNQAGLYKAEDAVAVTLTFPNMVLCTASWNSVGLSDYDWIEIVGQGGRVRFSCFDNVPITLETADGGVTETMIDHPQHVQQPLIQTVVDELTGVGVCPSHGDSAARTTRVIDEVLREYRARY
jgi:predicted dehydrogenase